MYLISLLGISGERKAYWNIYKLNSISEMYNYFSSPHTSCLFFPNSQVEFQLHD